MGVVSGIVVYILVWWVVIFCALPFNIRSHDNNADDSMPGAPLDPGLKRKMIATTAIAAVIWLVIYFIVSSNILSYRAIAQRMAL